MEQHNQNTVPRPIEPEEYFAPGHRACIGCGEVLALRMVCKALGKDVIIANATGCMEIVSSPFPNTSWRVPWIHTLFENTAAVAAGIESAVKILQKKGKIPASQITVVAMAGDGGTSDIGFQALSGALERGHNFIYVCFDNEAYMNTGIQRSSSTPFGAMTTTSPPGKVSIGQRTQKKNMPEIAVAHNIPYVATANHSYPRDLANKVAKAKSLQGAKYLHVYSACPTGWRCAADLSIELGRLAVETGMFPLYEVENGTYRLTKKVSKLKPVSDYLKLQGRFRHLTDDMREQIQRQVDRNYQDLMKKAGVQAAKEE
jgi:pyruvate ferredoxin oxidoreductase beta subunit